MKKLKLNLLNLEGAAVLTRQQLKMVMGGMMDSGGSGDSKECENDSDCGTLTRTCPDGTVQTAEGRCYAHAGATKKTCHYGWLACVQLL